MKSEGVFHPIPKGTMIGHSIGLNVQEEPMILKNNEIIIKKMVLAIEPVICNDFY